MALRVLWDEQETAILVDYFFKIKNGNITKNDAFSAASTELRELAIKRGIEIDETYRNVNGIKMQMSKIEDLVIGRPHRLSKAPQVFEDVVNYYLNDKTAFNKILREARSLKNKNLSIQEQFFDWLSGKISSAQLSDLYFTFPEIENLCIKRKILEKPLFETTDLSVIYSVKKLLDSNVMLKFTYRKKLGMMKTAIKYYCDFLEQYQPNSTQLPKAGKTEPEKKIELKSEIVTAQKEPTGKLTVDFESMEKYSYTQPEELLYFGSSYTVKNWTQLYVQALKCLYEDYPNIINGICGKNMGRGSRIDIGNLSMRNQMVTPKEIANGLYLETNLSAANIVSKIKYLLDICNVDYENVIIIYSANKETSAKEAEIPKVINTDGDILLEFLIKHEVEFTDNRNKGGCLWIKGEQELKNVVNYCKAKYGVVFKYKREGAKTFNGAPGWWTKDSAKTISKKADSDKKVKVQNNENITLKSEDGTAFLHWMVVKSDMALSTARIYVSAIKSCENIANELKLESTRLYGGSYEEAKKTYDLLIQAKKFEDSNKKLNGILSASLKKFLQYLSENNISSPHQNSNGEKPVLSEQKADEDLSSFEKVLLQVFPKGYLIDSNLNLKRFINGYNEMYKAELDIRDEETKSRVKENILKVGIRHKKYVFAVDSLLKSESKDKLFAYIEKSFNNGKKVIYYKALFNEFSEEFLGQRIYDEEMLRSYLVHERSDYFYENKFMSKEKNVQIDLNDEVRQFLILSGKPMKVEEIYKGLPHISEDLIYKVICTNKEFVWNAKGEYIHVSMIDFSDDELDDIAVVIQQIIEKNHFISGNELIRFIREKYPDMLERFSQFSDLGIRNALAYLLADRFSFNRNIISDADKQLTMSDVFAEFAKTHDSFTLDELTTLKNEMNSTIYFDAVYENSLRISHDRFVSREKAFFDITETDKAIASFCTGKYISLSGITGFGSFPYAGFPWNIYLLEHYVAAFSKDFKLLHNGFNADKCAGAIVKRNAEIGDFNDLLTDALCNAEVEIKNNDDALQYLCDMGYIARKSLSSISQILVKVRARKG